MSKRKQESGTEATVDAGAPAATSRPKHEVKLGAVKASIWANPTDGGTRVSWIMEGKNGFVPKAFSLLMNMDKMVGKDFEEGLANLNTAAQAEARLGVEGARNARQDDAQVG